MSNLRREVAEKTKADLKGPRVEGLDDRDEWLSRGLARTTPTGLSTAASTAVTMGLRLCKFVVWEAGQTGRWRRRVEGGVEKGFPGQGGSELAAFPKAEEDMILPTRKHTTINLTNSREFSNCIKFIEST